MRMMMNQPLMAAKQTFDAANARVDWEDAHVNHPNHPSDEESIKDAADHLKQTLWEYVATPAYNGREILLKLEELLDHTPEWRAHASLIERDLTDVARPQPSRPMFAAFEHFRVCWIAVADYDRASTHTDEEALRLHGIMSAAADAVFTVSCATPGDFLVKSYINLLWHAGHTAASHLSGNETGSYFDIAISDIDSESALTDAYYRSVYDDLDHSDLGACLLATGNIDFDPLGWIERAGTIGMPISLIVKADGAKSLNFGFIDSDDDRLHREERRLQQILTFDSARRWKAVADFIAEHRGDLVYTAAVRAKSEPYKAFHDEDMQESGQ